MKLHSSFTTMNGAEPPGSSEIRVMLNRDGREEP
jgi:hypothetical protein